VDFGLIVIDTRGIAVILDDVNNEPRDRVQSLKSLFKISSSDMLKVAADAGLGTNTEEQQRHVLYFQNALLRQLGYEGNECLLRRMRALECEVCPEAVLSLA
jgi:hypothetical protein